jgi:hypothetical protein
MTIGTATSVRPGRAPDDRRRRAEAPVTQPIPAAE